MIGNLLSDSVDTERMAAVRDATREVTSRWDRKYYLGCIEDGRVPAELLEGLADSGLLGVGLAEDLGGSGGGISEEVVLKETLSLAGLPLPYLIVPNFCRRVVAKFGTPEQRKSFIPGTLTGTSITCFGLTEAESGTNAFAMRTRAEAVSDGWLVNGQKIYISGAGDASRMLLVARTGTTDSGRARLSLFILDLPRNGVTMTPMRTSATLPERQYVVSFDDVLLPPDALVGEEGQGDRSMFFALNPERILGAAGSVGLGMHLLNRGAEFVKVRAPFGRPTGSYQAVQHPMARAYLQLQAARNLIYQAAADFDRGRNLGTAANAAKFLASEAAYDAYEATFQSFGGAAFDRDSDILPFYELARLQRVAPINNETVLNFIAEKALGLPRSDR
ncbi:acyl-CoA dehydrogenase family protein [Rhodococcus olei]|uniref:Acyl-CoA dehydrogenase family protein n=2 Tax=Rhodococcus olei TaxID=2161675 RepID=A0ABP8PR28_9NOCA